MLLNASIRAHTYAGIEIRARMNCNIWRIFATMYTINNNIYIRTRLFNRIIIRPVIGSAVVVFRCPR